MLSELDVVPITDVCLGGDTDPQTRPQPHNLQLVDSEMSQLAKMYAPIAHFWRTCTLVLGMYIIGCVGVIKKVFLNLVPTLSYCR